MFKSNSAKKYDFRGKITWDPIDIEELADLGKTHKFCPYYLNRIRSVAADIVLVPYNYVADADIRDKLGIDIKNDILIIDEAHNI